MTARTWLFVPGDRPDRFDKAVGSGADAVILDLEDGVGPARKDEARRAVATWLAAHTPPVPVWVRLSAPDAPGVDLDASKHAAGVVVPKAIWGQQLALARPVVAMVETAGALTALDELAGAADALMLGEYDLTADLGMDVDVGDPRLDPLRIAVVVASAAAGIQAPIGPVDGDFSEPDQLERSTDALRRLGFGGRAIIHPNQIGPVHRAYTPTIEEVAAARDLVERFTDAGSGAAVDDRGRMVDEATVRRARAVLRRAGEEAP